MDRILVVVDESETHERLLAEAGEIVTGTGAELVVFSWMTPDEAEAASETLESIEQVEQTSYSDPSAAAPVEQFARSFADKVFADFDQSVEYDVEGVVTEEDDRAEAVIDAAERLECDHVFIVGRKRSPTGKALFGDFAQRVLLNFGGTVTIKME